MLQLKKQQNSLNHWALKPVLSDYGVKQDTIEEIVKRFEDRKWLDLGDRGLTTPEATRKALEYQL